jgi:hypothetical protein
VNSTVGRFDDKVVLMDASTDFPSVPYGLASEEARHITGAVLPIDLGELAK